MAGIERRTEVVQLTAEQISAAISDVLPGARVTSFRLATQGRANTNYVVETNRGVYLLRIYVRAAEACAKERAIHAHVAARVPVAKIWGSGGPELLGHPFSVLDFMPGITLEELLLRGERAPLLTAARALGQTLATLTTFHFDQFGDLAENSESGALYVEPWDFGDFYRTMLFESPAGLRLGSLRDRVWDLIARLGAQFSDSLPIHLVHGDFNPSNLLLRPDGEVAAVLDWEFSHAGKIWQDLGNLFRERPEFALPEGFDTALIAGFAESGTELPSDWRAHAQFADLASALDFLSSVEEKPETHARALAQINRLLERFGG